MLGGQFSGKMGGEGRSG